MGNQQEKITVKMEYGKFRVPKSDENLVYHYCSTKSFFEIIRSGKIRMGNLLTMNDPSELSLRNYNLARYVYQLYEQNPFEFIIKKDGIECLMYDYLYPSFFESWMSQNGQHSKLFFAFCLSEDGDSLAQWRQYGENGKGFCLGFDKAILNTYAQSNKNFDMQQVVYLDNYQNLVNSMAEKTLSKIKELYDHREEKELSEYGFNFISENINDWAKYKLAYYKNEKEVRLTYIVKSDMILSNIDSKNLQDLVNREKLEIAMSEDQLKVYKILSLNDLGLKTITLGPQNNSDKQIINLFLGKNGVDVKNYNIYKANIPYKD